jgi:hypothetical protein
MDTHTEKQNILVCVNFIMKYVLHCAIPNVFLLPSLAHFYYLPHLGRGNSCSRNILYTPKKGFNVIRKVTQCFKSAIKPPLPSLE